MNNVTNIQKGNIVAIVVAAGIGSRIDLNIPKQYIKLGKFTILEYTINKLLASPLIDKIVVVINQQDTFFSSLPIANHEKIQVTYGGKNRSDSVLCGLELLEESDWALVHDAARPCITHEDISLLIKTVLSRQQGAILATRVTDTIKKSLGYESDQIEKTYDRCLLWAAATPQMFNAGELKDSLLMAFNHDVIITDEASAIEYTGGTPLLVECRRDNIKVTLMEDISLARFYLKEQGCLQD